MMKKIDLYDLTIYTVPARGYISKIYLHWSAGRYGQFFSDYHLNIDHDGSIYSDMNSFTDLKNHTWHRNTGAIGIALACCYNATPEANYGEYPPTEAQIDTMAKIVGKLCVELGLDVNYDVMTHAEVADVDGYGLYGDDPDCRWDLYGMGGDIRAKAIEYMNKWRGDGGQ